ITPRTYIRVEPWTVRAGGGGARTSPCCPVIEARRGCISIAATTRVPRVRQIQLFPDERGCAGPARHIVALASAPDGQDRGDPRVASAIRRIAPRTVSVTTERTVHVAGAFARGESAEVSRRCRERRCVFLDLTGPIRVTEQRALPVHRHVARRARERVDHRV